MEPERSAKEAEQDLFCITKGDYWRYLSSNLKALQKMRESDDLLDVIGISEQIELMKLTNWYMKELYEIRE